MRIQHFVTHHDCPPCLAQMLHRQVGGDAAIDLGLVTLKQRFERVHLAASESFEKLHFAVSIILTGREARKFQLRCDEVGVRR